MKPRLKNSYIQISKEGQVVLKTPYFKGFFAKELLEKKEGWIRKKLEEIKKHPSIKVNLKREVLLFGEVLSIDDPAVATLQKKLQNMKVQLTQNVLKHYNDFYKNLANEFISQRVSYFSQKMNLQYSTISYRKMKSRWGSCSSKKALTFNSELMKIDKELIDYVVVHELAHLCHMNHSKEFHQLVESYFPNATECRKKLKKVHLATFENTLDGIC